MDDVLGGVGVERRRGRDDCEGGGESGGMMGVGG